MAATKLQLIDRAMQLATNTGGDSSRSLIVDAEATAELALPHALRAAVMREIADGKIENVLMEFSITIASGTGDLPENLLREYLDRSTVPADQFSCFIPYEDYGRYKFSDQMKYYAVRGDSIYYSGSDGTIVLSCAGVPETTADPEGELDGLSDKVADDTALILAAVMKGEILLKNLVDGVWSTPAQR